MAACPNHMNAALSYINPGKVAEITVYPGIAPVSVGGDSIGGVIHVRSAPPAFASSADEAGASGTLGSYYHSNGNAVGYNAGVEWVGERFNLSYSESQARSGNYKAGGVFKPVAKGREDGPPIPGDVVGSSGFSGAHNREVGIAFRQDRHVLQLTASEQRVGFEGFPNQRMDMTDNKNTIINLRYFGEYDWGALEARFSDQDVRHQMGHGQGPLFLRHRDAHGNQGPYPQRPGAGQCDALGAGSAAGGERVPVVHSLRLVAAGGGRDGPPTRSGMWITAAATAAISSPNGRPAGSRHGPA